MLIILTITILLFVFVATKTAKGRGVWGEHKISNKLGWLPSGQYIVLNDLLLPYRENTAQIDHVVVSIYGIFVIETKTYKGIITGSENSDTWTQHLWTTKNKLHNPIRQNAVHINAIRNLTRDIYYDEIFSIIAFSNEATLRIETETIVTNFRHVRRCIRRFSQERMNGQQMKQVAGVLLANNIHGYRARKQHIEHSRERAKQHDYDVSNMICPYCGHPLVLRNGPYGAFYACSNYPKCKFTKS